LICKEKLFSTRPNGRLRELPRKCCAIALGRSSIGAFPCSSPRQSWSGWCIQQGDSRSVPLRPEGAPCDLCSMQLRTRSVPCAGDAGGQAWRPLTHESLFCETTWNASVAEAGPNACGDKWRD